MRNNYEVGKENAFIFKKNKSIKLYLQHSPKEKRRMFMIMV